MQGFSVYEQVRKSLSELTGYVNRLFLCFWLQNKHYIELAKYRKDEEVLFLESFLHLGYFSQDLFWSCTLEIQRLLYFVNLLFLCL